MRAGARRLRIEKVKKCESLQEEELKALCEYVGLAAYQLGHDPSAVAMQRLCRAKSVASDRTLGAISCSQVKEILVEESNVQPVNAPVTVRMSSQGMLSAASMQLLVLTGSPGCAPHTHACRSAVTSMASSMTCCACLRLAGRCPPPTTFSWVTLWTGATTGWACCTEKQAWVQP